MTYNDYFSTDADNEKVSGTLPDESEGKDSHVSSEQASLQLPTVPEPEKIAEKEADKESNVSPQKASLHTRYVTVCYSQHSLLSYSRLHDIQFVLLIISVLILIHHQVRAKQLRRTVSPIHHHRLQPRKLRKKSHQEKHPRNHHRIPMHLRRCCPMHQANKRENRVHQKQPKQMVKSKKQFIKWKYITQTRWHL